MRKNVKFCLTDLTRERAGRNVESSIIFKGYINCLEVWIPSWEDSFAYLSA